MSPILSSIIAGFAGYLLGSIPFGYLAGRFKGVDLRTVGSGNIGATNTGRALGFRWFLIVFLLDMIKGLAPVLAIAWINRGWLDGALSADVALWTGIGAIVGHSFPVWLEFKGGKAVATGLGVLLGLHPVAAAIAFGAFLIITAVFRYVSIGSVAAAFVAPIVFWLFEGSSVLHIPVIGRWFLFVAAALFIFWRHRANIARVMAGTEPRIGGKPPALASGGGQR
jgi:glycerol-3-phosphate acyltransferase PlsY